MKLAKKIISYVSLGLFMLLGLYYLIGGVISISDAFSMGYAEMIIITFLQIGLAVSMITFSIIALVKAIKKEDVYYETGSLIFLIQIAAVFVTDLLYVILYARNNLKIDGYLYYVLIVLAGAFVVSLIARIKKTNYILSFVGLGLIALYFTGDMSLNIAHSSNDAGMLVLGCVSYLFLNIVLGLVALKIFELIEAKKANNETRAEVSVEEETKEIKE